MGRVSAVIIKEAIAGDMRVEEKEKKRVGGLNGRRFGGHFGWRMGES